MLVLFAALFLLFQGETLSSPLLPRSTIASPKSNSEDYLLPTSIRPNHYTIELEPDFENDVFNGSVAIEFTVLEATNRIYFHARELQIDSSSITLQSGNELPMNIYGFSYANDTTEICTVQFADQFVVGKTYTLNIPSFTGILNPDNAGFYLAKYEDENSNEIKMATTQFESTSARRAFPCLDEPALKATFTLSIIRPENYHSISNTNPAIVGEPVTPGRYRDTFKTTEKMSTYLLAFIVSQFDHTQTLERHTVYARPQEIAQGTAQFALETGEKALKAMEDFVNVKYSLEKMDQAAIPNNYFAAGAMENWGLVTYREAYILYDNKTTLLSQKQKIATVIAHEFSHQWFGDLVSPKWWTYIWLNEGFATYFETYAASVAEPEWALTEQFVLLNLQYSFASDALESTRAMNTDVGSPNDISALFDDVAYDKSGCVIRMLEGFLTTDVFKAGLNRYLTERAYQAAEPSNLYSAFQNIVDESGLQRLLPDQKTVSDVLSTWDSIPGYPVVTVERNYDTGDVKFNQSRFLLKSSVENSSMVWYIPINYAIGGNSDFSNLSTNLWLTDVTKIVTIEDLNAEDFLIVNKQVKGYYRVNYDRDNWKLISNYLISNDYTKIHRLNRAQLLDDAFNLARSGRLNYQIPLELALYLSKETDYFPLYSFLQALTFINTQFAASAEYEYLKQYVINLLNGAYGKLGTSERDDDTHLDVLNRANILTWLCRYGQTECREAAHNALHEWRQNGNIIPPNLQTAYICAAVYETDLDHWDFIYQQLATEKESMLRTRIINGLGCSESELILEEYLDRITSPWALPLSASERLAAFASVYNAGNIGLKFATNYLKTNFDKVKETIGVTSIIAGIAAKLTTDEQVSELAQIVSDNNLSDTLLSTAKENVEWCNEYLSPVETWLFAFRDNSSPSLSAGISLVFAAIVARFVI